MLKFKLVILFRRNVQLLAMKVFHRIRVRLNVLFLSVRSEIATYPCLVCLSLLTEQVFTLAKMCQLFAFSVQGPTYRLLIAAHVSH